MSDYSLITVDHVARGELTPKPAISPSELYEHDQRVRQLCARPIPRGTVDIATEIQKREKLRRANRSKSYLNCPTAECSAEKVLNARKWAAAEKFQATLIRYLNAEWERGWRSISVHSLQLVENAGAEALATEMKLLNKNFALDQKLNELAGVKQKIHEITISRAGAR